MATIIARVVDKGGHWYDLEGAPRYTVKAKDGSNRPTTLRDARKLGLVPSVTTIMKVAAAPALEAWKMEQMLLAALTLPRMEKEPEDEFISRVIADSKETGKRAAERGTRIHESIEKWYEGDRDVEHKAIAESFEKAVNEHFKTDSSCVWVPEASFASAMGFGGKVDLHCASTKIQIVVDAKTKEFTDPEDVRGYDEHVMQLAAYRHGLGIPAARCANVFASVSVPGLVKVIEWSEEDLQRGWEMFCLLLDFWKVKNRFGGKYADQ